MTRDNVGIRTRATRSLFLLMPVLLALTLGLFPAVSASIRLYTEAVVVQGVLVGSWSERSPQRHGFVERRHYQFMFAGEVVDVPDGEVRVTGHPVWLARVPNAPHIKRFVNGPRVTLRDAFGDLTSLLCFIAILIVPMYGLLIFLVFQPSCDRP